MEITKNTNLDYNQNTIRNDYNLTFFINSRITKDFETFGKNTLKVKELLKPKGCLYSSVNNDLSVNSRKNDLYKIKQKSYFGLILSLHTAVRKKKTETEKQFYDKRSSLYQNFALFGKLVYYKTLLKGLRCKERERIALIKALKIAFPNRIIGKIRTSKIKNILNHAHEIPYNENNIKV